MKRTNLTQAGRSMIEMLGVLAVIGVLTVGGFSLISKVSTAHKTNVTIDEIGSFANRARAVFREFVLYKKKGENELLTFNSYLKDNNIYPTTVEPEGTGFLSNNDIKYSLQHIVKSDTDYFYIEISQLDEEMCMAIAQSTWGSPALNGYVGICVGSSCGGEEAMGGVAGVTPGETDTHIAKGGAILSLDGAANACDQGTSNKVYLTFR